MQAGVQTTFRERMLDARGALYRFLTNGTPDAVLNRGLAVLALVTIVTASFSIGFHHPDEHYQVLEFMSYKLGLTSAADLPWEFNARIRSWMQPFLYYLIAKPLIAAGVRDLFTVLFVLQAATGALSMAALTAFAKLFLEDLRGGGEKHFYALMLPFMGFLPYIFVRTSSETMAGAFLVLGLVLAVRAARSGALWHMAAAGFLNGMAFECRLQPVLISIGLFAWLAVQARARTALLASFLAGAAVPVLLAFPIDHWGYGVWSFPPWDYFNVNLLQGAATKMSGAAPFYAYLYLVPGNLFLPLTAFLLFAMVVACLRNPRHYVTWTTVPFFLVHCLLARKTDRFLFPLAILATSYPVLAFSPLRERLFAGFGRLWEYRRSLLVKAVAGASVAAMVFCAVYPVQFGPHRKMARYLYRSYPQGLIAYTFEQRPFTSYPMFRPPGFHVEQLKSRAALEALLAKGPVNLIAETPTLPAQILPAGVGGELLYSEMPFADRPGWARLGTQMTCALAAARSRGYGRPPPLAWMTLFRLARGAPLKIAVSPCLPAANTGRR